MFQVGNERKKFYQQTINELTYKTTNTSNSLVGRNDNGIGMEIVNDRKNIFRQR